MGEKIIPIVVCMDGNHGGDILEIQVVDGKPFWSRSDCVSIEDAVLDIKVGSCCIYEINAVIPVEVLTGILSKVMIEQGSLERAIHWIGWGEDFTRELLERTTDRLRQEKS